MLLQFLPKDPAEYADLFGQLINVKTKESELITNE